MSRDVSFRSHLCRATGKIAHAEFYDAARHMRRLARKKMVDVGEYTVYRCDECNFWHVGHAKSRRQRGAEKEGE